MRLSNHLPQFVRFMVFSMLLCLNPIDGLRILGLFPHPGVSHFYFFQPILLELAARGHNVTVVSHFPTVPAPDNYRDLQLPKQGQLENSVNLDWFANRNKYIGHFMEFFMLRNWGMESCEIALNSSAVKKVLKMRQRFDVIIMEQFNTDCLMGLAHKLQSPVIGLSSCAMMPWHYERVGQPHIPSYIPALFMGASDDMNFGHRLANWLSVHGLKFLKTQVMDRDADRLVKQYLGEGIPSVTELAKGTSAMFVNTHYSLSGVKPLTPNVVELGGIHIKESKPLDAALQKYLDNAEHGVIYVSWGSMIRAETLPMEKREGLLKAFSQFKQNVIWKWENETLQNQPSNVLIQKWLPQRDILCHPKVRVFVSHGGLMGSSEAAHCGVPVVLTPMYGDQFLNSAAMAARGMGQIVHYEDLSAETMTQAIRFALEPSTQEKARQVQYSYRNRLNPAKETAAWWVEHVAATAGAPLAQSRSIYMPSIAYYHLDVYAFLAFVVIVFITSWVWFLRSVCSVPSDKSKKKLKST